jgi:hypothetical protein
MAANMNGWGIYIDGIHVAHHFSSSTVRIHGESLNQPALVHDHTWGPWHHGGPGPLDGQKLKWNPGLEEDCWIWPVTSVWEV